MMMLVWIILFVGIMALIKMASPSSYGWSINNRGNANRNALDILNERYARGDIGNEEFEERKHILKHSD